jgi:hypothetical protein
LGLGLALVIGAACTVSAPAPTSPVAPTVSPEPAAVPEPSPEPEAAALNCPEIDTDALEKTQRNAVEFAEGSVPVKRLFRADPPAPPDASGAKVRRTRRLGIIVFNPHDGDVFGTHGVGMGWHGLHAGWFESGVDASVRPPLHEWDAAQTELHELQSRGYVLGVRARFLSNMPEDSEHPRVVHGPSLACTRQAEEHAKAGLPEAKAKESAKADALMAVLEARPQLQASEKLLLGGLLESRLPYPPEPGSDEVKRVRSLLEAALAEGGADPEIRARSAEMLARVSDSGSPEFRTRLRRVLKLTRDPDLKVETLVKLAAIEPVPAKKERLFLQILQEVEEQLEVEVEVEAEAGADSDAEDVRSAWRVAWVLADLAELHLERGAYTLARDEAARCAREGAANFPRNADPWSCAVTLAEALAELGEVPEGLEVPARMVGPLALALMRASEARFDRGEARRVGARALEMDPDAAEAPQILGLLAAMSEDADEREAIEQRLAELTDWESSWTKAQRARLAEDREPSDFKASLDRLTRVEARVHRRPPTTDAELEEQLGERAGAVAWTCLASTDRKRRLAVTVETGDASLRARVRGGSGSLRTCVRRATEARFRGLEPGKVSFTILAH